MYNVLSNPAKYWKKYIDFMCNFIFQAVNAQSLAQILGPFGQIWVFHKFGWVFHNFTENGEFYIVWILTIRRKNRDAWPWQGSTFRLMFSYLELTQDHVIQACML